MPSINTNAARNDHELMRPNNSDCLHCQRSLTGASYPFELDGHFVCERCYNTRIMNRIPCDCCQGQLQGDGEEVFMHGGMFCRTCSNEMFSRCRCCGHRDFTDNFIDSPNGVTCRGCYQPEWNPGTWEAHDNSYREVPRKVTFGIELETSRSHNYQDLEGQTHWGCFREASTAGREFVSPILVGDAGLDEIEDFIDEYGSDWAVDANCGTHIHLGVNHLTLQEQRKVAYAFKASEPVMAKLLPRRIDNYMCGRVKWSLADLMNAGDIEDLADASDKFQWLNLRPLLRFGTFEVRLLSGTLDPALIRNWIRFNTRIIKVASKLSWRNLEAWANDPEATLMEMQGEVLQELYRVLVPANRRGINPGRLAELEPPPELTEYRDRYQRTFRVNRAPRPVAVESQPCAPSSSGPVEWTLSPVESNRFLEQASEWHRAEEALRAFSTAARRVSNLNPEGR